ncbi:EAL domain-containing protein [Rhizobiaceae bacterium BDR2-2]|uniref:EAL domain-containing protein n=1 Tax=Ectorhizobium quercum TaxID=2965071 RepID=A0AAE3MYH8_9HYPH|nr:EAL domain-containing protein [Ectorhizobium quercum]MCX8995985.1 EAL domain-containing protein [Ectorhizobium quercum]
MTLGRRASAIILPVVLLSNILIAVSVYWLERDSIERGETARLSRQMERLQSLFDQDLDFARNLVFMMQTGDAVRAFMREADESFRTTALGVRVQEGIEFFSSNSSRFVSFAILQNDLSVAYYFEKSDDPFASIPSVQIETATRRLSGVATSSDEFVQDEGGPLIIHTALLDRTTFSNAFATQRDEAFIVQAAVRPRDFLRMKDKLEKEYGTALVIAPEITGDGGQFMAVSSVLANLKLGLPLTDAYLAARLQSLKATLAIACLLLSFGSVGLLLFLIRRIVTKPIAVLDSQVTDILSGRRLHLDRMTGRGEIERLTTNIKTLHDQALDTLDKVQTASWTDSLTGISNRSRFTLVGKGMIEDARAARECLSLLFIDLDNFKFVNDTFGHAAGDAVLQRFTLLAREILAASRQEGPAEAPGLARLSGDEFAILLQDTGTADRAAEIAARIVDLFRDGLAVGSETYPVSASIGIASFPADARSLTQLVSSADKAMYHAKASGKNRITRYSSAFADGDRRIQQIRAELQRLDPDEEFSLVYMPIVSRSGVITRCEALLRWTSPVLGEVSPREFIPLAETNALFSKIDRWVLQKATGDLRQLQQVFGDGLLLGINISTAELRSSAIIDHALQAIGQNGVPASSIELELTETFSIGAPEKVKAVVQGLKDAGFRIALDDFGAGFTSLKQILEYPLDTVKLDRDLVGKIHDGRDTLTLNAIIDLCHSRGCVVVAQGVRDKLTQTLLALAGCDLFEGHGVGAAVPLEDLLAGRADAAEASGGAGRLPRRLPMEWSARHRD